MSLISLHIFVGTQLARKELLLTYLSPTDLSPSVAEDKPFSVCCCQCLVLLSTDLIFFVCVPIPFSASRGFSKCSWILTSWTWMGSWTSSVDPQLPVSSQGFPTLTTWQDPSSPPQVSGISRQPDSHNEPHLLKQNTSNKSYFPRFPASFVFMQMSIYGLLSKLFISHLYKTWFFFSLLSCHVHLIVVFSQQILCQ